MNKKTIIKIMLGFLIAVILFHLSIILKIVPYDIAWGGRLTNDPEMYLFETISITILVFLCVILLVKGTYLKPIIPMKIVDIILWGFLIIFTLNTIGNVLARTNFEKFFAILTFGFSIFLWIIVGGNKKMK